MESNTHLNSTKLSDARCIDWVLRDRDHGSTRHFRVHTHVEHCLDPLCCPIQEEELGWVCWVLGAITFGDEVSDVLPYH